MYKALVDNPALDVHAFVQDLMVKVTNVSLQRKQVKTVNFGIIYGMGVAALASALRIPGAKAKELRNSYRRALPGIDALEKDIQQAGSRGEFIRTWGGRVYFAEETKVIDGRAQSFAYKLLNYLMQGSAADNTKEAIINYGERLNVSGSESRFLVTVHDEINASFPQSNKKNEMMLLRDAMEDVDFADLRMATTGKLGPTWADTTEYRIPGDL